MLQGLNYNMYIRPNMVWVLHQYYLFNTLSPSPRAYEDWHPGSYGCAHLGMRVCVGVCGLRDQVGDTACHLRDDLQEENIRSGLGRRQHHPCLRGERGT